MGFKIKIDDNKIFKAVIDVLSTLVEEMRFKVYPDKLVFFAIDSSGICILTFESKKSTFSEFVSKANYNLFLSVSSLDKIFKRSGTSDSVEVIFDEKEDNKIKILMTKPTPSKKTLTRTFSLALLETEEEEVSIEGLYQIDYDTTWDADSDFLTEALRDAEIYSEVFSIISKENEGLVFTSVGEIGEMEYNLDLEDLISEKLTGKHSGSYSLTFLKAIQKLASISGTRVTTSLKTDHPLRLSFNFDNESVLDFFLAPRVEDEELDDDVDFDEE